MNFRKTIGDEPGVSGVRCDGMTASADDHTQRYLLEAFRADQDTVDEEQNAPFD